MGFERTFSSSGPHALAAQGGIYIDIHIKEERQTGIWVSSLRPTFGYADVCLTYADVC